MTERPSSDLIAEAAATHTAIPERRRTVVVLHLPLALLALLLKVAQLCRHRIFTTCRVYRKLPAKVKVGVLLARAMPRFTFHYARIMLDAFALLLFLKIFWKNCLK